MTAIATRIIESANELEGIVPAWWALWRRCPARTPFQSPGWLMPWWQAFGQGRLQVIAVSAGERLVVLLPFYVERNADETRLLPLGLAVSDYLDVLIEPGYESAAADVFLDALTSDPRWASLELQELAPDAAALCLPRRDDWKLIERKASPCPVLYLDDGTRAQDTNIPARQRRRWRMAHYRALRRGKVEFVSHLSMPPDDLFDWLVALHATRWQTRKEPGVLTDARVQSFHRSAIARLNEEKLVRLHAVKICGQVAAVYYGFADNRRAYAYLSGFDPQFAYESPGTLLLGHVIDESRREGIGEFHFLRGREDYKYQWGARDRFNLYRAFRRSEVSVHAS